MFKYQSSSYNAERSSVITREQAEHVANLFEAADMCPYSTDWDKENNKTGPWSYLRVGAIVEVVKDFPNFWTLDVSHVLDGRRKVRRTKEIRNSFAAVQNLAIREYLRAFPDSPYLRKAETRDESGLCKLATTPHPSNHKPAYVPKPGCKGKLKLREAVVFYYEQASYADHTRFAVPVEFEGTPDRETCCENLGRFCAALRTHNGFAGSGCTWSCELITNEHGSLVVMDCRSSISD
jgi:hypothetical protein